MFEQYPKRRASLSAAYNAVFNRHFMDNRTGGTVMSSLAGRMEDWMHRRVAQDLSGSDGRRSKTLEIGAGTLNHLPFEERAEPYDIVEPFTDLYRNSPQLKRIRRVFDDIGQVPVDEKYARIVSIAVLEHVLDLPWLIARTGLLLEGDGQLRMAVPSEGTLLWKLGWMLTTGLEFRLRHGLSYGRLMRHLHVNTAREIEQVLGHFFARVSVEVLGLSRSFSLYRFYACSDPIRLRCRSFLEGGNHVRTETGVSDHSGRPPEPTDRGGGAMVERDCP